jgi:uncharacterized membrane protein YjjP (DUF1212 family)
MKRSDQVQSRTDTASGESEAVSFHEVWQFVLKVGEAAKRYGSSTPRLQAFLEAMARYFGYEGVFNVSPREIVFALREAPGRMQRIELMNVPSSGVDLNKLARLGDLLNEVKAGKVSLHEASDRMEEIDRIPVPWAVEWNLAAYCLIGLGLPPILGAGWPDSWVAMVLSAVVYGIVLLSGQLGDRAVYWMPLTTAFVAAVLATLAKIWVPELNLVLVILSAVAVLLPGYTISLGVIELAAQYVVSGAATLINGLVYIAMQVAGGWLGIMVISHLIAVPTAAAAAPVPGMWLWGLVALVNLGLCIVFQTSYRDFLWAFVLCMLAYLGIYAGSVLVGGNFGNLLGTIIAAAFSNLWSRWTNRPTSIVLIPAIVLLVSGSIGFRGLASLAEGQLVLGSQEFFQMFVVALTISAGLLIGNTLFRPKIAL